MFGLVQRQITMSPRQHPTTRRAFITALGFGGVSLYGAWAAYGAAPLPFLGSRDGAPAEPVSPPTATQGHGGHGGGGAMTPEEFLRNHGDFIARFELPDGSVAPRPAEPQMAAGQTMPMPAGEAMPMPAGEPMPPMPTGGHDMHDMSGMSARAPAAPATPQHDGADSHGKSGTDAAAHGSLAANPHAAPLDVYLLAYRFGFAPEELRLEAGRPYRFRMMASDIAHGASLNFGAGSRIIRLRPNVVSEQTITFQRPSPVLVYCTVFCGPAHDAMKARILVA